MAEFSPERRFTRIDRLPPYVFNITAELKMAARRRGEDIIDFSMGNPDGPTPPHIVEKLCTVAQRPDTHGYSTSRGIPRLPSMDAVRAEPSPHTKAPAPRFICKWKLNPVPKILSPRIPSSSACLIAMRSLLTASGYSART